VAIYPDSVASAHTLLVEPWLVLVLPGRRRGRVRRRSDHRQPPAADLGRRGVRVRRVVEAWAIIPVLIVLALGLRWPRRMAAYLGESPRAS